MLTTLLATLKDYGGVEYMINQSKVSRIESYYVKKQLEMNRSIDVTNTVLTVYKVFEENGKKLRGSSTIIIHPTMSDSELKDAIDEAVYAAGFVKNEYYPLVTENSEAAFELRGSMPLMSLHEAMEKLRSAVYGEDNHDKGHICYSEYFIAKKEVRIINSAGVDVSYTGYYVDIETAIHWKDGKESEIIESYKMSDCDTCMISERVGKLFTVASQKPLAQLTPALTDINILLSGECLETLFSYYHTNSNASTVYSKMSTFGIGDNLQGDSPAGDIISMDLDPSLPGSVNSAPYDADGFSLKKTPLIKDGKLLSYWGSVRFASYLNIPPTGTINNYTVEGGSMTVSEMKSSPYLDLISFSDFQMNALTGDFGGEIRLGFYYNGSVTVPVTGGSISGNIKNVHGDMHMSVERSRFNNYYGPQTVRLRNVSIAGK